MGQIIDAREKFNQRVVRGIYTNSSLSLSERETLSQMFICMTKSVDDLEKEELKEAVEIRQVLEEMLCGNSKDGFSLTISEIPTSRLSFVNGIISLARDLQQDIHCRFILDCNTYKYKGFVDIKISGTDHTAEICAQRSKAEEKLFEDWLASPAGRREAMRNEDLLTCLNYYRSTASTPKPV